MSKQISYHKATYVSLKIHTTLSHWYLREVWNYQNGNYTILDTSIEQYNWDSIIDDSVVDSACEKFTDIFLSFCKECNPRKKVIIRPNDKPWFNSELRHNIRLRDRVRKKALGTILERGIYLYKKKQRNRVNNMKKLPKKLLTILSMICYLGQK